EPVDRIFYGTPVQSLVFAQHDVPYLDPSVPGGAISDTKCDPKNKQDPFRPPADFVSAGAGPRTLRGTFAFLSPSNGQVGVVDVDDLDQACRRPIQSDSSLLGCTGALSDQAIQRDYIEKGNVPFPSGSDEVSCQVFRRHGKRSRRYFTNDLP